LSGAGAEALKSHSLSQGSNIQELKNIRYQREALPVGGNNKKQKAKGKKAKKAKKEVIKKRNQKGKNKNRGRAKGKERSSTKKGRRRKNKGRNGLRKRRGRARKQGEKRRKKEGQKTKNKRRTKKKGGKKRQNGRRSRKKAERSKKKISKQKNKKSKAKKKEKRRKNNQRKQNKKKSRSKKERSRQKKKKSRSRKTERRTKSGIRRREKNKNRKQNSKKRKNSNRNDKQYIKKTLKKVRNNKNRKRVRQSTEATVNLTCIRDAITFTKFLKDNVVNFLRRNTRLTAQNDLTNKKAQKKGEYKEPAARLIQAGGGDKTNLSCSGSTTGVGAKRIKAVADILDGCEIGIKKACKPPDSINTTTLDTCKTNAVAFNKTVNECITKATKGEDACSCFQADEVRKEKKVLESCKGKTEAKAAAKARTACLKVIKECKNASASAALLQYACRYSTPHLMKTLKQLKANLAAFKSLIDKVKDLTGLSPKTPSKDLGASKDMGRHVRSDEESEEEAIFDSHQARLRGKRQQQACSTITTTITTCTTTISNKPASIQVTVDCKTPTFTISTCTDADKTAIQTALDDAIDKNAIIIAFISAVSAELKEVTGTAPSDSDLTATAKSAARSRSELRKMLMEKMNLRK